MPDHLQMITLTPEQFEKGRAAVERVMGDVVTDIGARQPADPMADVHAAIKFLSWCALNQKPTALAIEWLTAAALKVAR